MGDLAQRLQLFNRACEFARARLHFVEQPRVLDRDDGLVGERFGQLDLLNGRTAARCIESRPMGTPSRRSGTATIVRKPPNLADSWKVYSGSAKTSGI